MTSEKTPQNKPPSSRREASSRKAEKGATKKKASKGKKKKPPSAIAEEGAEEEEEVEEEATGGQSLLDPCRVIQEQMHQVRRERMVRELQLIAAAPSEPVTATVEPATATVEPATEHRLADSFYVKLGLIKVGPVSWVTSNEVSVGIQLDVNPSSSQPTVHRIFTPCRYP